MKAVLLFLASLVALLFAAVFFSGCQSAPSPMTDLQTSQGETAAIIGETGSEANSLVEDLKPLPIPDPVKVKAKRVADNLAIIRARYSREIVLTKESAKGYAATIMELNAKKVENARLGQIIIILSAIIAAFVGAAVLKLKGLLLKL